MTVLDRLRKRYQVRYKYNRKHLWADVAFAAAIVVLVVANIYIAFFLARWVVSLNVQVTVLDATAPIGQETTMLINYENRAGRGSIDGAVLTLDLPASFVVSQVADERYDAITQQLTIGEVPPRSDGQVAITGTWWAPLNSQQTVRASMTYTQADPVGERIRWQDTTTVNQTVTLTDTAVPCQLLEPQRIIANTPVDIEFVCTNNTAVALTDVTAAIGLPTGFTVTDSQPQLDGQNSVTIDQIQPTQPVTLTINGLYQPDTDAMADILFDLGLTAIVPGIDQVVYLGTQSLTVGLYQPAVTVAVTSDAVNNAPQAGETVNYTLTISNDEEEPLTDVVVELRDVSQLIVPRGTEAVVKDGSIMLPEITQIAAGEQISVTVPLQVQNQQRVAVGFTPWLRYRQASVGPVSVAFQPYSQRITANLGFQSFARYYTAEGEQLGIGPIPPIVGFPTHYRIFWQLDPFPHTLQDVIITAKLPSNVAWAGDTCSSVFGQSPQFNAANRLATWTLETVETGRTLPVFTHFCAIITPTAQQVGTSPLLMYDITASGTDQVTGRTVTITMPNITTNLTADPKAAGQGVVQP